MNQFVHIASYTDVNPQHFRPDTDAFTYLNFFRPSAVSIETMHAPGSSDCLSRILITKFEGFEHELFY
jgi:hypothetical protein